VTILYRLPSILKRLISLRWYVLDFAGFEELLPLECLRVRHCLVFALLVVYFADERRSVDAFYYVESVAATQFVFPNVGSSVECSGYRIAGMLLPRVFTLRSLRGQVHAICCIHQNGPSFHF
jgi:hypothetical protein